MAAGTHDESGAVEVATPRKRAPFWEAEARLPLDKAKALGEDCGSPAPEANATFGLQHALWFRR